MKYKILGRSGLRVSELCLGTMSFGEEWGWGTDKKTSKEVFDAYAERGGNFIDTANRYTEGTSEKYVGDFIASDRDHFVLATKYTLYTQHGDPNKAGNHRKSMVHAVEGSLKRLDTDYIDLYWLHAWDFTTPVEEVMRALDDLVRAGKILHIGVSDTPAYIVSRANTLAELRGWSQFVGYQIEYSLIERTVEREMIPTGMFYNMPILAWSTLAGGLLSGKYATQNQGGETGVRHADRTLTETEKAIVDTVQTVADDLERSSSQVATRWALQKPGSIIPILGAKKLSYLVDTMSALEFELSDEHMKKLDKVSEVAMGFPLRFLQAERIENLMFAGTQDQIDRP